MSNVHSEIRNPLCIGIAGLGRMGMYHVERIGLRDDSRVVAVYDVDAVVRDRLADLPSRLHAAWDDFLSDPLIDVVLIATPPATHARLALDALRLGKHVIVEPPLCLTLDEADALLDASRRADRMLSVAQVRRWDDDFRTAQAVLQSGALGRPVAVKRIVWQYHPHQPAASDNASAWRNARSTGGGTLWEFGTHLFDQLLQLVPERPTGVSIRLTPSSTFPDLDDGFLAVITFESGVTAHIEANRAALAPLNTGWMIAGTTGAYANFTHYTATDQGEIVDVPLPQLPTEWDRYYTAVVDHLRHGGPNPVPAEEAHRVLELIEIAGTSGKHGR